MNSRRKRKARFQWPIFCVGIGLGVAATLALQYLILEDPVSLSGIGVKPGRSAQNMGSVEREFPIFTFFRSLPDFELEVDTSHSAGHSSKASRDLVYLLQVAAYRQEDRANAHRAALILEGLDTYVVTLHTEADDPWYQVRMGPFETSDEANTISERLIEIADGERVKPLLLVQR